MHDTQDIAEALIHAEIKLGELLADTVKQGGYRHGKRSQPSPGGRLTLPEGITYKESHHLQRLASYPDVVSEYIAQAREKNEIPFRKTALSLIRKMMKQDDDPPPELPDGIYNVIYADPPSRLTNVSLPTWYGWLDTKKDVACKNGSPRVTFSRRPGPIYFVYYSYNMQKNR